MSAYKRFISYLYEYNRQQKGKNCGFVRVEVRNHQCRLDLHMTLPQCPFTPVFRAYACVSRSGRLHGLLLGNLQWKQGNVHGYFQIPDTGICDSSWNLNDLDGLVILCDTGQRFATCWNDCPILPDQLLLPEQDPVLKAASLEPEPSGSSDSSGSSTDASPTISEPSPAPVSSFSWKRLEASYPQVTPFFDEEIHNCLQLSPKDIPTLGSFGIPCGKNQFFLYGSHAFQHFLLGQTAHGHTICYILAVPGIYTEKEKLMAGLFGFPYFKSARSKDTQSGQFGYWYRTIHTEPSSAPISP